MKLWITLAAVVVAAIGVIAYKNSTEPPLSPASLPASVTIYDVRTPEEYAESHVSGAKLLPLQDIENGILPDVPKESEIAVYCRSGNRSSQAAELLKKAGFTNVTDIGGLNDIGQYGLNIE